MRHFFFLFGAPGLGEWVVILLIVLVLFGASRLPQIARSLGEAIKEFKKASKDSHKDDGHSQ
jgi:sec-independent protein translocase protein TatA